MSKQDIHLDDKKVVVLNGTFFPIVTSDANGEIGVRVRDRNFRIETDWSPRSPIFAGTVNGEPISLQIEKEGSHYSVQHTGLTAHARVMSPLAAEMLGRMPEKEAPDTSGQLTSPMPGLLVSLEVEEGQDVKIGEPLAVIEAMKMENQLFAERDGVVAKIHLTPGDSLDVGELILELR